MCSCHVPGRAQLSRKVKMEKMGNRLNLKSDNGFDSSSVRSVSDGDAQSDRSARSTQSSRSARYVMAFSKPSMVMICPIMKAYRWQLANFQAGGEKNFQIFLFIFLVCREGPGVLGMPTVFNNTRSQTPDRLSSSSDTRRVRVSNTSKRPATLWGKKGSI